MISWLASKLYVVGGLLLALISAFVWHKRVVYQRDEWKMKAQEATADRRAQKAHDAREAQAQEDMKDEKMPEHLRNPRDH